MHSQTSCPAYPVNMFLDWALMLLSCILWLVTPQEFAKVACALVDIPVHDNLVSAKPKHSFSHKTELCMYEYPNLRSHMKAELCVQHVYRCCYRFVIVTPFERVF